MEDETVKGRVGFVRIGAPWLLCGAFEPERAPPAARVEGEPDLGGSGEDRRNFDLQLKLDDWELKLHRETRLTKTSEMDEERRWDPDEIVIAEVC